MTTNLSPIAPSKSGTRRANALPSGCMLDEYRIDSILGAGGFGVTYKALDTHLETWVAIKEYFPVEWSFRDSNGVTVHANTQGDASATEEQTSDYLWGLERFLDEARVLARVQNPCVVRVKRYFRAHGTAYIVMDFEEGEPLSAVLQDGETLDENEVRGLLADVLPALQAVHDQGYLHRDIKPANLYRRAGDQRVMLIDFGAAREAIGRHSKSVTSLVTPGYSPPEQYTTRNDRYGTWTDIYALGAVLYRCVTGHTPTEAAERLLEDTLEPAVRACAGRYSTNLLRVIDRALAVRPELRFRTVAEMQAALGGSRDENSDETIIMAPLAKPGKPAPLPERSSADELSGGPDVERGDGSGWLDITRPPILQSPPVRQRLSVLQGPPPRAGPPRWRLGVLTGGGLALAGLAAALVWFWPSGPAPEGEPAASHRPGPKEQPAETPVAHLPAPPTGAPAAPAADSAPPRMATEAPATTPPAAEQPSPPPGSGIAADSRVTAPSVGPSVVETTVTAPPLATESSTPPPQAGDRAHVTPPPETGDMTGQAAPVREPAAAGGPPEPSAATGGEPPAPAAAAPRADTSTDSRVKPATAQKPRAREATTVPPRTPRQETNRKRKPKPAIAAPAAPAAPVQAKSAPVAPRRSNSWDAPTDTGFNQK
jgi:serine/threonine protein kinase